MHSHIQSKKKQEVKAHTYRFQLGEQIIIDTFNSYYLKCVFPEAYIKKKGERNSGAVRWIAIVRFMLHLWWHTSGKYMQDKIMSACNSIMLTCNNFLLACNIIMSTSQIYMLTCDLSHVVC